MLQTRASSNFFLKFAVLVSIFGLISIPMFALQPHEDRTDSLFRRILVGSLYAGICLLGISAVFYPKKCEKTFIFEKYTNLEGYGGHPDLPRKILLKGHHPDCEKFSANRIRIKKTVLCSSCTGLLIGAMIALAGTVLYFFAEFVPLLADSRIIWVGETGILLGLVQFKFGGYLKLAANAFFVVCSFMTLVLSDLLSKSLSVDLYVLGLIVFLLLTRITISEWNNKRICIKCEACELRD